MGEYADMAIDAMFDYEEYMLAYPEEYEEENADMSPSPGRNVYRPKLKVCRNCGKGGFHWGKAKTGWRLFDKDNRIHNCNKKFTKKEFGNKKLNFTKKTDESLDYTKDAEFWAKTNPQALYWYMVKHPEKAKNVSEKAGAILAKNLR